MTETIPLSGVSYSLYPYAPFSYREAQHPTFNFYSASFQVCGMHVYPRHTWASYIQLSDRLSRPLVFKLILLFSFYSFKSFFYKRYFKDDGLLPNLIAALGRKSRPAVKGSWNARKMNKSYHLPHFIHFFERGATYRLSMYLSNPITRTKKRKKEDASLRRSRVKTSSYWFRP